MKFDGDEIVDPGGMFYTNVVGYEENKEETLLAVTKVLYERSGI